MTFTPTPKDQLTPLSALADAWASLGQQLLSRLHHLSTDADWAALAIADLYTKIPAATAHLLPGFWSFGGLEPANDPGQGAVIIEVLPGNARVIALSTTDDDGMVHPLAAGLLVGDAIAVTDGPPVTMFRQYTVLAAPGVHGTGASGWVSIECLRTAAFGDLSTPPVGPRLRLAFQ